MKIIISIGVPKVKEENMAATVRVFCQFFFRVTQPFSTNLNHIIMKLFKVKGDFREWHIDFQWQSSVFLA